MVHVTRRILPNYDIHESTGFPTSVPVPNKEAARQIVQDMIDTGMFLPFVSLLMEVDRAGFVGRRYRIPRVQDILAEVTDEGYSYDEQRRVFVENSEHRKTKNWGVLRPGEMYTFAFLRMDIVGNSELVRVHGMERVSEAYAEVRGLITRTLDRRNGRIWSWEGDGGLAAFYTDDINSAAVSTAMELLHELFLYNLLHNGLDTDIHMRLAVHSGQTQYQDTTNEISSEVIKKVLRIEAEHTERDSLTISETVYASLDPILAGLFTVCASGVSGTQYNYRLLFEE